MKLRARHLRRGKSREEKTIDPIPDKLRVATDTVLKKLEWPDQVTALAAAKRQLRTASCDFINNCEIAALYFEAFFRYFILCLIVEESVHMPSEARDKVVENSVSRQAEELAAKSAEAHGAQTKSRQQADQSKQDSTKDASRETRPARRKRSTKATKTQQQKSPFRGGPSKHASGARHV